MTRYGYVVCKNHNLGNLQASQQWTVRRTFKISHIFTDEKSWNLALFHSFFCYIMEPPTRVFPIFGATFFTLTELISWIQRSNLRNFLFSNLIIHSSHQKKLFGTGYGRSSGRTRFWFFLGSEFSESLLPPTWRAWPIMIYPTARRRRKILRFCVCKNTFSFAKTVFLRSKKQGISLKIHQNSKNFLRRLRTPINSPLFSNRPQQGGD